MTKPDAGSASRRHLRMLFEIALQLLARAWHHRVGVGNVRRAQQKSDLRRRGP